VVDLQAVGRWPRPWSASALAGRRSTSAPTTSVCGCLERLAPDSRAPWHSLGRALDAHPLFYTAINYS
ncbi:hypothetical protein EWB00_000721, partial [Schistosoma japonicum]